MDNDIALTRITDMWMGDNDEADLFELERVIQRGLATFVEVGNALAEIRDRRLYRAEHKTFEDYCRDRWGLKRQRAYELMDAAGVVKTMSEISDILPERESHAAPLTGLPPEQQAAIYQEAVETAPNGKVTAAHVEEVVERRTAQSTGMAVHFSSKTDEWETPQRLFDILDDEFGFTLDVCALAGNAKCDRYFTPKDDGLSQDWGRMGEVCWMNPPYGDEIPKWVAKARQTAVDGSTVVCLLPARVDTSWWWDNCRFGEVRFLRGRLRFGGSDNSAPFPSAVVIFRPGGAPKVIWWEEWQ